MKTIVFTPSEESIFIALAVKVATLLSNYGFIILANDHFIKKMAESSNVRIKPLSALDSPATAAFVDCESCVFRFSESPVTLKIDLSILRDEVFILDLARLICVYSLYGNITDPRVAGYMGPLVYALAEHRQSCVEAELAKRRAEKDVEVVKGRFSQMLGSGPLVSVFGKLAQDDPYGLFADWAHRVQPVAD